MDNNSSNTPNQNKVPFDPGWNDPPTFSYNAQQTQPSKPRKFLNKRVPFPMSSSNTTSASMCPMSLPPTSTVGFAPPTLPLKNSVVPDNNNEEANFDSDELLKVVKEILLEFLNSSSELGVKSNDIQKRIGTMEDMWANGKLNRNIQLQMKELAYAIRDDQPNKADDIHRALMVDHVSVVGTWMPGIKQLVHHCRAKSELLAIDKND